VRPPRSTSDAAPSHIKTPDGKNLRTRSIFQKHIVIPLSSTQDREGPEALPGTLPERGIATGALLHRHACLWRDE
jgi:hypothetical protein